MADLARIVVSLWLSFLPLSDQQTLRPCTKTDYAQLILPCDEITLTRSVVYYLNATCQGGDNPPVPKHGIPCNCPSGQGLSPDVPVKQQKCLPCKRGKYGAGGEVINNWQDWTNNGTMPPEGSPLMTYCEISRDYVKFCEAWKASADNYSLESGENSLSRCMVSVLFMTRKFVKADSTVSFDYRVDSRECRQGYLGCDGLSFFIDSQQVLGYTGNQFQWVKKTYNLTTGTHVLKWIFRKRCYSYGYTFLDKAYIRSITLIGTAESNVRCEKCPPGHYGNITGAKNCTPCPYFQYQPKRGQQQCVDCPPNMYAMLGASKCLPLPNCTDGDIIKAPGDVSACSCDSSPNTACSTTVQPYYMAVKGFKGGARILCSDEISTKLKPQLVQCQCQPGFEIDANDGKPRCKKCEKGQYSTAGIKCNTCQAGQVAFQGKHYYVWRNNTLPKGFTAQCAGDCGVKSGWISAGGDIRTERVVGNVHAVLQSPEVEVDSELARIMFNCYVNCILTGAPKRPTAENLAKISDCNLIFQVLFSNNTIQDQLNCTHPKGMYGYGHDKKRDGRKMVHVYPLKKGKYFFRWVFHQQDETRTLSTAFQAKVADISILGTKDGEARNCTPCPAGYHSISGNTDCTICPNGTASPPGSKTCNPCKGNSFAAQVGSATCLRCGNNTQAFPTKDGCTMNGCKFTAAEGVEYDLNKLSRPGGPMIEVLYYQRRPRRRRTSVIWPYRPALYVNLCTLNHDNSSCAYYDRASGTRRPRPVMACRSSWYRDIDIGSVIGYSAKDDVRSGLFVELLHGEKCYSETNGRLRTTLDLRCDVKAGVGNPGPENNHTNILRGCEYYLVWKSLYACPKCRKGDVRKIVGECVNGSRSITYVPSVPCWGTGEDSDNEPKREECITPTVTIMVNGTVVAYRTKDSNRVNKILIGVGVVIVLVLLGVAGFFVYKHRLMKYRYYALMAQNKPMSRLAEEDDETNFIEDDELAEPLHDASGAIRT